MSSRISPLWWPVLALSSPVLLPYLFMKNRRFKRNVKKALAVNEQRIEKAGKLELPELTQFELSVLVAQKTEQGFLSSSSVSYFIKTDQGSLLFDLGYGPEDKALTSNAEKIGFSMDQADAVAIT